VESTALASLISRRVDQLGSESAGGLAFRLALLGSETSTTIAAGSAVALGREAKRAAPAKARYERLFRSNALPPLSRFN
jgi:hypothetical protein